jgi:hypothetical protein
MSGEGFDLSQVTDLFVTISQYDVQITKTMDDIDIVDGVLYVPLSQEETLRFRSGKCDSVKIQVRGLIDGKAFATNIATDPSVYPVLLEGVIPDEE